jgi:hypothetical protein
MNVFINLYFVFLGLLIVNKEKLNIYIKHREFKPLDVYQMK